MHGESGYHIDPYHGAQAAELMADFFEEVRSDRHVWEALSNAALHRIYSRQASGACSCFGHMALSSLPF